MLDIGVPQAVKVKLRIVHTAMDHTAGVLNRPRLNKLSRLSDAYQLDRFTEFLLI